MTHDALGHETRFSDSSFYDTRCIHCGATDAPGGGLLQVCPQSDIPTVTLRFTEVREVVVEIAEADAKDFATHLRLNRLEGKGTPKPLEMPKSARIVSQSHQITGISGDA